MTLGCSKNVVDSEHLAAHAQRHGWSVAYGLDQSGGGTLILNTCGFIGDAKEESIEAILQAAAARSRGDIDRLLVMGCLSQRYPEELAQEIPEVDAWYGVHDAAEVLRALGCPVADYDPTRRLPSSPSHYAYLKIAEGCDRACAFCAIPSIRGGYRSAPVEELVQEAQHLQQGGARELILIAQELTYYGHDQREPDRLLRLLERLERLDGIDWLRLHYAYPTNFSEGLIRWMATSPRACRYLDLPLQHISDRVLRSMRRAHGERMTRELVERLRVGIPGLALRTTLIVGYPTETEEDFRQLLDFVRQARFEHLGVFTYSEEEGTPAAGLYADGIPEEVKRQRRDEVMALQQRISLENKAGRVGQTLPVMVDYRLDERTLVGRTEFDSPEVDGEVIVRDAAGRLEVGDLVPVRITASSEYDLEGEPA